MATTSTEEDDVSPKTVGDNGREKTSPPPPEPEAEWKKRKMKKPVEREIEKDPPEAEDVHEPKSKWLKQNQKKPIE